MKRDLRFKFINSFEKYIKEIQANETEDIKPEIDCKKALKAIRLIKDGLRLIPKNEYRKGNDKVRKGVNIVYWLIHILIFKYKKEGGEKAFTLAYKSKLLNELFNFKAEAQSLTSILYSELSEKRVRESKTKPLYYQTDDEFEENF